MARRQQRAARNARRTDRALPPLVPLLAPFLAVPAVGGCDVTLAVTTLPVILEGVPVDFFLTGVPRVYSIGFDELCTTATKTGSAGAPILHLTFPTGTLADGDTIFFQAYDPAIRTEQGGFVAPAKVTVQTV